MSVFLQQQYKSQLTTQMFSCRSLVFSSKFPNPRPLVQIRFAGPNNVAKHRKLTNFSVFIIIIATLEIMFEVYHLFELHSHTLNINTFIIYIYKYYPVLCFLCQSYFLWLLCSSCSQLNCILFPIPLPCPLYLLTVPPQLLSIIETRQPYCHCPLYLKPSYSGHYCCPVPPCSVSLTAFLTLPPKS